ncbi:unnamed protein product [Ectocarpus fasciculatus]
MSLQLLMSLQLQAVSSTRQGTPAAARRLIIVPTTFSAHASIRRNDAPRTHPHPEASRIPTPPPVADALQAAADAAQPCAGNPPEVTPDGCCGRSSRYPSEHHAPRAAPSHVCRRRRRFHERMSMTSTGRGTSGAATAAWISRRQPAAPTAAQRCRRRARGIGQRHPPTRLLVLEGTARARIRYCCRCCG